MLNSAPASRGVPLHGSRVACGTLCLHPSTQTASPSIFLISFLPASRCSSLLVSRSHVISSAAVNPSAHAGPRGTVLFPPALVRERGERLWRKKRASVSAKHSQLSPWNKPRSITAWVCIPGLYMLHGGVFFRVSTVIILCSK